MAQLEAIPPGLPLLTRDVTRPLVWVRSHDELADAASALMNERIIGLDVETTLGTSALCLVQIAGSERTYLLDALELSDLTPLARLLSSSGTTKIIHNASFEREVLARHGLPLEAVVDTREMSRDAHGRDADEGHSLRALCARELRMDLDKQEQTGDWARRPLSISQIEYAALDAEVLLRLHERLRAHYSIQQ